MRLDEAKDTFLSYCESIRKLSQHTIRAYRLDLDRFVGFAGGDRPALTCDKALLQDYVKFLFEERGLARLLRIATWQRSGRSSGG
ncbi:MAG TPA: site-specific integrase [Thermoanaerobaculia bacterium]|nr:site-specific integrase [Thermoanaerobaculia bacterium]